MQPLLLLIQIDSVLSGGWKSVRIGSTIKQK